MGLITLPNTFVNGTLADADQVNANFNTLANEFNGLIDNANIKAAAGILGSKIASAPNGIDTAQINDDAVTSAKLRDDAATDGNRAVTTDHIRDGAVTTPKLGPLSIGASQLGADCVIDSKVKILVSAELTHANIPIGNTAGGDTGIPITNRFIIPYFTYIDPIRNAFISLHKGGTNWLYVVMTPTNNLGPCTVKVQFSAIALS